jgi:hypothetical protein
MGSKVGGSSSAGVQSKASGQKYGSLNMSSFYDLQNATNRANGKKDSKSTEPAIDENLGSVSSVSTIRKNRGLLSNSMSDTLG